MSNTTLAHTFQLKSCTTRAQSETATPTAASSEQPKPSWNRPRQLSFETTLHVGSDGMTAHQRIRGKVFNQQIAAFGEQILFQTTQDCGTTAEPRCEPVGRLCWLGNTRTGEDIVSNNAAVVVCRSIRRRNKEERWNRAMLLGVLGNLWSLRYGRMEVDCNLAA